MRQLTARFVDTLKTERAREEIRDREVEGLELRVTREGTKTWCLRYRRRSDGRKRVLTIGRYPDFSLLQARDEAEDARRIVARGGDPCAEKATRKHADTFAELASQWMSEHCELNKRPRSILNEKSILNRHLLPSIGDMRASEVTRRDISLLLATVAKSPDLRFATKGAGRKTRPTKFSTVRRTTHHANRVFAVVRAIYRWAVAQGLLQNDPTWRLRPPIVEPAGRDRVLTRIELHRFWRNLDCAPVTQTDRVMFRLALVTAQRIGEIAGLAKRELDLESPSPLWTIPSARSKNRQSHKVWLSPLAVRLIREAEALNPTSAWLFPLKTKNLPKGTEHVADLVKVLRPVLDLENFVPHDLRRTAATFLGELGVPDRDIEGILNHISGQRGVTRKHYDKARREAGKREALMMWSRHLEEVADVSQTVATCRDMAELVGTNRVISRHART